MTHVIPARLDCVAVELLRMVGHGCRHKAVEKREIFWAGLPGHAHLTGNRHSGLVCVTMKSGY